MFPLNYVKKVFITLYKWTLGTGQKCGFWAIIELSQNGYH